jgi:hypothetical protein
VATSLKFFIGGDVAGLNHEAHKIAGPDNPEKTIRAKAYTKE